MNQERVKSIIDNRIKSLFLEGCSIENAISELKTRNSKFYNIVDRDENIDTEMALLNPELYKSSKIKFAIFYVISSEKRIQDLEWMLKNAEKFSKFNNQKFFKLVQLRDRMIGHEIITF